MKNRINVHGLIAPADFYALAAYIAPDTAVFPQDVAAALKEANPGADIVVDINSRGGYTSGGNDIVNMIRDWCRVNGRKAHVEVGAQAASMAAVMAFSFNGTLTVHRNSEVMIHAARVFGEFAEGATAQSLRDTADCLDVFNHMLVNTIVQRTGKDAAEVASWCEGSKETYFGVDDLQARGLVDGVIDAEPAPAAVNLKPANIRDFYAFGHRSDAGMLAAVAYAFEPKAETPAPEAPAPEAPAPEEPAPEAPAADQPEAPAPEAPAQEEPKADEQPEAPAPEESKADEQPEAPAPEAPAAEDTPPPAADVTPTPAPVDAEAVRAQSAAAITAAVAAAVEPLQARIAELQAEVRSANTRAATAEGLMAGLQQQNADLQKKVVSAALQPPADNQPPATADAVRTQVEWARAVRECGSYGEARRKYPELYARATSAQA